MITAIEAYLIIPTVVFQAHQKNEDDFAMDFANMSWEDEVVELITATLQ